MEVMFYNRDMKDCNACKPGFVASPERYNKATNCKVPDDCGLRTILIPKSKGSDMEGQPYAPQLGSERNTVVIYQATGSIYLYDDKGVYTNLTGASILPVLEQRQAQMEALSAQTSETSAGLATEKTDRIAGQTTLQAAIDALQTALSTETTERTTADQTITNNYNALQAQVNALEQSTGGAASEADLTALQAKVDNLETTTSTLASQADLDALTEKVDGIDVNPVNIVQTTGTSTTSVMSQDAVTKALGSATGGGITQVNLSGSSIDNQLTLTTTGTSVETSEVKLKTVGGVSIVGEGDIPIEAGTVSAYGVNYTLAADQLTIKNNPKTTLFTKTIPTGTYLIAFEATGITATENPNCTLYFRMPGARSLTGAGDARIAELIIDSTTTKGVDNFTVVTITGEISLVASTSTAAGVVLDGASAPQVALTLVPFTRNMV